jgi:hypothetical protein
MRDMMSRSREDWMVDLCDERASGVWEGKRYEV